MTSRELPQDLVGAVPFDFDEVEIGIAEYDEGPTGCTVLHFPNGSAVCATDIRGGSPGVIGGYARTDAVCFAGGSLYGLETVYGVSAELLARLGSAKWGKIAVVSGAIIFDFGSRDNLVYPDRELGRRALLGAGSGLCPVGRRGAGRLATVGKQMQAPQVQPEAGGQGAAFRVLAESGVKVLVVTVVNSIGVIVDRGGQIVRGCYDPDRDIRHHPRDLLNSRIPALEPDILGAPSQNTTLTAVVTNKRVSRYALDQLARQVHTSMARGIQPFHTPRDGDVLFALSTETLPEEAMDDFVLTEVASELAWDAVLNAVQHT